ncbi:LlaJI family restriction endonuclease [uncultured Treponema sp.]|uniref:LlaJI family restriction endonuclease n=1 Tax=uncultured Treponema sp. TaxID=162155 RepID=UPI00263593F1|nr:LlaJI family restriction endonuclease [uncultured Treponema sp.]
MKKNIEMKSKNSLSSCCVYFGEDKNDAESLSEKFVGLKCTDGKLKVYFPVGYRKPDEKNNQPADREKEVRRNILNLIHVLRTFGEKEDNLSSSPLITKNRNVAFPIHAYLFIIRDFLSNGYYVQKETQYSKSQGGKVSWSRTIKSVRPQFIDFQPFYFDFITQKTNYSHAELVSQIHKFCVHECFSKLGFLFSSSMPEKSELKLNKNLFVATIKKAIAQTFNENNLLLFKNMLDVLNFLDENSENSEFIYGTQNFHVIWEKLVDRIFGETDKEYFYPKVYWKLKNGKGGEERFDFRTDEKRNSLRPDTIMITNREKVGQKIFVLDSKYYRYGATKVKNHLPDSASIVKQFAYAEYIEKNDSIPEKIKNYRSENSVFNAFIMPACVQKIENIGYAGADYIHRSDRAEKSWHKIHGILLDTKTVMEHAAKKDNELIEQLAAAIEEKI